MSSEKLVALEALNDDGGTILLEVNDQILIRFIIKFAQLAEVASVTISFQVIL